MSVSDHPAWREYKATLARVAAASARLLAEDAGTPGQEEAEREFQEAMRAYERVRERLNAPRP